jgi:hypothetical protein
MNDSVAQDEVQARFSIDQGHCTAAAYRSVGPLPTTDTETTNTTFAATTSSGETISGTATSTQSGTSLGSVAEGMAQAQRQQQYQAAINSIYNGCMAERGWTLRQVQ